MSVRHSWPSTGPDPQSGCVIKSSRPPETGNIATTRLSQHLRPQSKEGRRRWRWTCTGIRSLRLRLPKRKVKEVDVSPKKDEAVITWYSMVPYCELKTPRSESRVKGCRHVNLIIVVIYSTMHFVDPDSGTSRSSHRVIELLISFEEDFSNWGGRRRHWREGTHHDSTSLFDSQRNTESVQGFNTFPAPRVVVFEKKEESSLSTEFQSDNGSLPPFGFRESRKLELL